VGVGIGFTNRRTHEIGLLIYTRKQTTPQVSLAAIPKHIENLPVRVVTVSSFRAL
jgi:hypothetical protein